MAQTQTWLNNLVNSQATQTAAIDAASAAIAAQATILAGNADSGVQAAAAAINTQLTALNAANAILKTIGSALPNVATVPALGPNELVWAARR